MRTSPFDYKVWNIEAVCGYKPKTTFYEDFGIAEFFGIDAIKDTYERCMADWKDNVVYLTELVMALNWKIWEHHDDGNDLLEKLYYELWGVADLYATSNLKGDDLSYFYMTTD